MDERIFYLNLTDENLGNHTVKDIKNMLKEFNFKAAPYSGYMVKKGSSKYIMNGPASHNIIGCMPGEKLTDYVIIIDVLDTRTGKALKELLTEYREHAEGNVFAKITFTHDHRGESGIHSFDVMIDEEGIIKSKKKQIAELDSSYVDMISRKCSIPTETAKRLYYELVNKFVEYKFTDSITVSNFCNTYNFLKENKTL